LSYQKFDEEFVTRRLNEHRLMIERRNMLLTKLSEMQPEIEQYHQKVGRPPLRKLSDLAKKVMANASKPLKRPVERDVKGRILPGKAKGASA